MPAVITDSGYQPGIVNQSNLVFGSPVLASSGASLLNRQVSPSRPLPGRTTTITNPLLPDLLLLKRLANFPDQIYDLSQTSVLYRFMAALLGPAGAGQLRQRQLIAQLQSAIQGTHFYDLDAFYGALFGAQRTSGAALPQNPSTGAALNPYTDLATQDGWDEAESADAIYRERIIQLARAISLGGTIPGIQAMAEAIVRVPCNVYEVWRLIDYQAPEGGSGYTWAQLQAFYPSWAAIEEAVSWNALEGIIIYGGLGTNVRNEVIIQPQRNYSSTLASQQQAVADASGISDVVRVLAPAFAYISVDTTGSVVDSPVTIAGIAADSNYWEVIGKVVLPAPAAPVPSQPASPAPAPPSQPYSGFITAYDRGGQRVDQALPLKPGVPPFSQSQGVQYSAAAAVAKSFSSTWEPSTTTTAVLDAPKQDLKNYQVVVFPGGRQISYQPSWGVIDPAAAAAGRAANPASMKAAPYSGARAPVLVAS
jgi:hypothetical protein